MPLGEVKMGFPTKDEIKLIAKKLENEEGTLLLGDNPSPLEVLRWELCQRFLKYKRDHDISQKELANRLGVDESKVSKILHHRIEKFSTDRLVNLYCKIEPEVRLNVG